MLFDLISHMAFWVEPIFLWYFTAVSLVYLILLSLGSFKFFSRYKRLQSEDFTAIFQSDSMPEITFIVPAYNEVEAILATANNLLTLNYRYKKIIIVNDGSTDEMMPLLKMEFQLVAIPKFYEDHLPTAKIESVYQSTTHQEIFVVDKAHRGKFDALNAGINCCSSPFFINVDADTIIEDEGFESLIRPILTHPEAVAVGATVRVRNDCSIAFNRISTMNFPHKILPAMQALEYFRAFLSRQGWEILNGHFVISGAFAVFPKSLIVTVGGFAPTVAEDMEIIIRLHCLMKEKRIPYKIYYLPDPVAWTSAPTTLKSLGRQRTKWHFGLLESLWYHRGVTLNPRYGWFGVLYFPFWIWGEALEPIMELLAWIYVICAWSMNILNIEFFILITTITLGCNFIFTIFSLFIEEFSYRKYPSIRSLIFFFFYSVLENFGYRQMTIIWRMRAFGRFFKKFRQVDKDADNVQVLMQKHKQLDAQLNQLWY